MITMPRQAFADFVGQCECAFGLSHPVTPVQDGSSIPLPILKIKTHKINENEFALLRTIKSDRPGEGWEKYSHGSYLLRDSAQYLLADPDEDKRVTSLVHKMRNGAVEMRGITLLAHSKGGPYTVAEGNARLIAVYINCIVNDLRLGDGDSIEVILGISSNRWIWSPARTCH
jgi:hypothetical protein